MSTKFPINRVYIYRHLSERLMPHKNKFKTTFCGFEKTYFPFLIFGRKKKKLMQFLVSPLWRHIPQNNSSHIFCSVKLSGWVVYCLFFLSNSKNARTFICSFHIWALCQQSPCSAGRVGMNSSKNALHFPLIILMDVCLSGF